MVFLVPVVTLSILHYLLNYFSKVLILLATMQMITDLFSLLSLDLGFKIVEAMRVALRVMKEEL